MQLVLVGALGYLGSRLATWLAARGSRVILAGRTPPNGDSHWSHEFEFRQTDVTRPEQLDTALSGSDAVVHLASLSAKDSAAHLHAAFDVSAFGTRYLVQAAERAGASRFVFFSTCNVYGPRPPERVDEQTRPWPVDAYCAAHLAGEAFCNEANERLARPFAAILRLSNTYGASLDGLPRFVPVHNDLCRQARIDGRIQLATPGLVCRDFVWIEDVAQAISLVVNAPDSSIPEPLFNLSSGASMTVLQLAERVQAIAEQHFGRSVPLERPAPPAGSEPHIFRISPSRLAQLGFFPHDQLALETRRIIDEMVC